MASINCLVQSDDGYIWLGTDGAELVRFDGTTFEEIQFKNGDNNHHYSSLFIDGDNILFASLYKGFYSYSRKDNKLTELNIEKMNSGNPINLFVKDSTYYFVRTRAINTRKGNTYGNILALSSKQDDLRIFHSIETAHSIFIFTNHGAFQLTDGAMIPLEKLLDISSEQVAPFKFGFVKNNQLHIYSEQLNERLTAKMNSSEVFSDVRLTSTGFQLNQHEKVHAFYHHPKNDQPTAITNKGALIVVQPDGISRIQHNYKEDLLAPSMLISDLNGDYWIGSKVKGLYKVSHEAFTKIQSNALFNSPTIYTVNETSRGEFIICDHKETTAIGSITAQTPLRILPYNVSSVANVGDVSYFATENGVRLYDAVSKVDQGVKYFSGKNVQMVFVHDGVLWAGIAGEGLSSVEISTGRITKILSGVGHYYSAQLSKDEKTIFFGTNYGVRTLKIGETSTDLIKADYIALGGYSGVSTTDIHGTCWFTLEKGIIGITPNRKIVQISGNEVLNSNLFYTLNSDRRGHLILGTNKGLTVLKVDARGKVLSSEHYDANSGFLGYETNMRAQYQTGDKIFLGTVEGLFLINTALLYNFGTPIAPVIIDITDQQKSVINTTSSRHFSFKVNNPKTKKIIYSYRIKEISEGWVNLGANEQNLIIEGVDNGDYTLEVRSSYDGINFSASSSFPFSISNPFWLTNWFIILLICIVLLVNFVLIYYFKSTEKSVLVDTKDLNVHLRMTPTILLFACLTTPLALFIAPYADSKLQLHLISIFVTAFVLFTVYFLSLSAKNNKKEHLHSVYLKIALITVLSVFLFEAYNSRLNPYYSFGILLVSLLAPYIFNRIRYTIVFSVFIFLACVGVVLLLGDTIYPKMHFLTAIFFLSCLLVFSSYLRFDSLEKLIFISGIINKGNIPAIAFDKDGIVTYASENISNFFALSHDELLNNNISVLNRFVPQDSVLKNKDVTKEFKDGEKYLVPMHVTSGEIKWIEWSYKDFSRDVKVILGQDVSEKMELENTYELLVQNAEDYIYRCDTFGNYLFLNDVSFQKLGYTKEELIGKSSLMLVHEDYRSEVKNYYKNHFDSHKTTSYKEFPVRKKDGEILWIGQYVTTLYAVGSTEIITGFIALARDITELRNQQEIIKEQRDSITSSINYARRIQYNLLPSSEKFSKEFGEHFVISKPKDIVSGDFYWMERIGDNVVLALADCTGHGVPGSFMTLLGFNLLNSIVLEGRVTDPATILNELDKKLIEYLPKGEGDTAVIDGMEIVICVFNDKTNEMSYGCAGSRFLVFENNSLTMFKGNNKHIGDIEPSFAGYNSYFKEFTTDYYLFLFSDGFQDQFGGSNDKKYSFRRLIDLFEANINLPLNEQRKIIESDFDHWIGDTQQTDDVTVLSVMREIIK